jgi:hypothetical protein
MFGLALLAGETNCDWWDKGGLRDPYFSVLLRRHAHLTRPALEANRHKIPDILTWNGTRSFLNFGRHEYYEIKPDNPGGEFLGQEKLAFIEETYRKRAYRLPYKRGSYYPDSDPKIAAEPIEIKIPTNRVFKYLMRVLMKNGGFTRMRVYMKLRRPEEGLLLYKLCIELEDEDRKRRGSKVLTKAIAKHVYATYLAVHHPQAIKDLLPPLGDFSYQGQPIPTIACEWNVVDELAPYYAHLESMVYTRGLGEPGDHFVVYCDEAVWQYLHRPVTVSDMWGRIKAAAQAGFARAGHGATWAHVEPLLVQAEDVAQMVRQTVEDKTLIDIQAMADILLDFVKKHPGAAIAIALTPLFVCAGVAAIVEGGLLAASLLSTDAAITTAADSASGKRPGFGCDG